MKTMKRILITGGRDFNHKEIVMQALTDTIASFSGEEVVVVHGGAKGADTLAAECAKKLGAGVECHPADWETHGKKAGPIRNVHMVNLGADICLAFPSQQSKGTWHCVKKAREAGIKTEIHEKRPDGMRYKVIRHDVFTLPEEYVLAHCISQDAKMGAGIAKAVRNEWDVYHIDELSRMNALEVGTSVLQRDGGPYPIFHMITKKRYYDKPTRKTFNKALADMAEQVERKGIRKLGLPLIGSGLDGLDWYETERSIREMFQDIPVDIVVCVLPKT